jgi:putative toxin-antitoxin system antitoxin component (TIGR02293 family)
MISAMRAHAITSFAKAGAAAATPDLEAYAELVRTGSAGPYAYGMLLGIGQLELPKLLREIERGLPCRSYERLAKNLALSNDRMLRMVDIARRTLVRRRAEGRFSRDESDRLLRAARVLGAALSLFEGDRDAALAWLEEPQLAFGGAIPLEVARTEIGAREVEDLAYRLEEGVFS